MSIDRQRAIDPELRRVLAKEIHRQQERLAKIEESLERGEDPLFATAMYAAASLHVEVGITRLTEMGKQAMREDEYFLAKGDGK